MHTPIGHPRTQPLSDTQAIDAAMIVEQVSDAVIVTDLAFTIVRWNPGAARIYGWAADEVLGRRLAEVVPTVRYLAGTSDAEARERLATTGKWNGMVVQRHRDGHDLTIEGAIHLLHADHAGGRPVGVVAINRDVSAREQLLVREQAARLAAEHSQQRLAVLAATSRVFTEAQLSLPTLITSIVTQVSTLIGDGCVVRLTFNAPPQVTSVHHVAPPALQAALADLLATTPPLSTTSVTGRVLAAGEPLFLPEVPPTFLHDLVSDAAWQVLHAVALHSLIAVPIRVQDRMLGVLIVGRHTTPAAYTVEDLTLVQDIADRAALAIDHARLFTEAQAAVQVRETFLTVAAHELRTPLTTLLGHAARLRRRAAATVLSERDQASIAAIATQGERINQLVADMTDVARLHAGLFTITSEPVDLTALTRRIAADCAIAMPDHRLEIDLPQEAVVIDGDRGRIEQALMNVLHNAIKYSPAGGAIQVVLTPTAQQAILAVRDQGIGVPAAEQSQLFQQFYRASNVNSREISGFGIGLFMVRQIMERHGGSVEVASIEGYGSTFRLRFPRSKAH